MLATLSCWIVNIPDIGAAPSPGQVEDMIRTAASIKDPDLALECTNVVLDTTRIGLRSDTCAHQKPWWAEPERDMLNIPYTDKCVEPCTLVQDLLLSEHPTVMTFQKPTGKTGCGSGSPAGHLAASHCSGRID